MKPIGAMGNLEYICSIIAIAGIVSLFTGVYDVTHQQKSMFAVVNENEMNCPNIRVRHFVNGDLKTGVHRGSMLAHHI